MEGRARRERRLSREGHDCPESDIFCTDTISGPMAGEQRLTYHQTHSQPQMVALHTYMKKLLDEHRVEPNCALGEALRYMLKHWEELTLFLRVAGASLDNNVCERALRKAILHRKNALFYKTANGALVGDLYMSLIHTCELNDVNPFDYLVTLLRHSKRVREAPSSWLPWNHPQTLQRLTQAT